MNKYFFQISGNGKSRFVEIFAISYEEACHFLNLELEIGEKLYEI